MYTISHLLAIHTLLLEPAIAGMTAHFRYLGRSVSIPGARLEFCLQLQRAKTGGDLLDRSSSDFQAAFSQDSSSHTCSQDIHQADHLLSPHHSQNRFFKGSVNHRMYEIIRMSSNPQINQIDNAM